MAALLRCHGDNSLFGRGGASGSPLVMADVLHSFLSLATPFARAILS
ncbi:hypothetical protein BIWAKO_00383 [Bosea sp. BIWAKO-01]|nr:hypothetical protein BIWAKO_00383 [Bosea sp. BIWAKO-01]